MKIKVLSWNIWVDGKIEEVKKFLKNSNAEIIGLQEVEDKVDRDVINFLRNLGYNHTFTPKKKIWGEKKYRDGPAIFAKFPIVNSKSYNLSKEKSRVAAMAEVKIGDKILSIFNTHLLHPHQQNSEIQNEQIDTLITVIPKENMIVMGDFNATPQSYPVKKMRQLFTDTDPNGTPTWSVYPEGCQTCNPQKIDTRLDYIFVSQDIKVISSEVEQSKASDHLPISAIIEIGK